MSGKVNPVDTEEKDDGLELGNINVTEEEVEEETTEIMEDEKCEYKVTRRWPVYTIVINLLNCKLGSILSFIARKLTDIGWCCNRVDLSLWHCLPDRMGQRGLLDVLPAVSAR